MAHVILNSKTGATVGSDFPVLYGSTHATKELGYDDLSTAQLNIVNGTTIAYMDTQSTTGYRTMSIAVYDEQSSSVPYYTLRFNNTAASINVYPIVSPLNANQRSVFLHDIPLSPNGHFDIIFDTSLFTLTGKLVIKAYMSS